MARGTAKQDRQGGPCPRGPGNSSTGRRGQTPTAIDGLTLLGNPYGMPASEEGRPDRRHRRREETIGEILDVAVELIGTQGAAGLSLGEVARRMGMRTPSLYSYFDSKNALYDAIFERGWQDLLTSQWALQQLPDDDAALPDYVLHFGAGFVRWAIEHQAYAQLLFWRPVPGYQPSSDAYASAIEVYEHGYAVFAQLHERGTFREDTDVAELFRLWTVLLSGVVSQQLANAPNEPFDSGTFTSGLPQIVAMFLAFYGPQSGSATKGRRPRAHQGRPDR